MEVRDVTEEANGSSGLWVRQESAIIIADSHDVWSFTPEFLYANEIVPDDWICHRATRTQDSIGIQYGPIHWYMTSQNLWIDNYPDRSIEEWLGIQDERLAPAMAKSYLTRVPYLPFGSLWSYWRISANRPDRHRLGLENVLGKEWPEEMSIGRFQPSLDMNFTTADRFFRIVVQDNPDEDAIVFECYTNANASQGAGDAILETRHWPEHLRTLQRAISHILGENVAL